MHCHKEYRHVGKQVFYDIQLRATIAQVDGKKKLTGRTDIEIEISNQCARLIANAIIYYNSAILSHLLTKCEASGKAKAKAVTLITRISPTAWRHILLNGHYRFNSGGEMIWTRSWPGWIWDNEIFGGSGVKPLKRREKLSVTAQVLVTFRIRVNADRASRR
jgi:hypothetical protein